jgi:GntR family transcriptional regulator
MALDRTTPPELRRFVPRYHEIEQALRERIAQLQPDDRLPSDTQLCQEFGVSRMTARNAVARLAQEGVVYRVPGRGTFVAHSAVHRQADTLLSFSDEMRRKGRSPSSRLLERDVRTPSTDEQRLLRLSPHSNVAVLTRVRLADGEPVALERAVLDARVVARLDTDQLEKGSLHRALLELGRVPTAGTASLGAAVADSAEGLLLDVPDGSPLLVERRVIVDQNGIPIELTESRYVADRYGIDVAFDVELAHNA